MLVRKCFPVFSVLLLIGLSVSSNQADDTLSPVPGSITVQPAAIDLRHQRQPVGLQVLATSADGYSLDLRQEARFTSADPKVAVVDDQGWIHPIANGQTQVTARDEFEHQRFSLATFVGVAAHSDVGAMQNFVSKYHLNFTNLNDADGAIWARYNVPWQPAWVFYRADGSSTFINNPTSAMSQQELSSRVAALTS